MTSVKVTIIGAGSADFSLGLVKDICLTEGLAGSQVCFMDINEDRLDIIYRLGTRYAEDLGADLRFERTLDRAESLQDADFVINTATVTHEEHFMKRRRELVDKIGYFYGRTGMPEYHNLQLMLDVALDMEDICPDAWILQAGNPVFAGTTLMTRETSIKVCGLCHGHYGYQRVASTPAGRGEHARVPRVRRQDEGEGAGEQARALEDVAGLLVQGGLDADRRAGHAQTDAIDAESQVDVHRRLMLVVGAQGVDVADRRPRRGRHGVDERREVPLRHVGREVSGVQETSASIARIERNRSFEEHLGPVGESYLDQALGESKLTAGKQVRPGRPRCGVVRPDALMSLCDLGHRRRQWVRHRLPGHVDYKDKK